MTAKRKVLENSILYTFSSILVQAVGFLLLPIYTLFLTPEDYGVTSLVNGFIQVTIFIVAFSLYSAAIRFYTDYKDDKGKLKRFYGTMVTFILLSGSIYFSLAIVFRSLITLWFFEGVSFYPIVLIALLTLIFLSMYTLHLSILQGMQLGKKLTIINLTVFGLMIVVKLFFVGVLKLGAAGFLSAQLIVYIGYFIFMIIDLKKNDLFKLMLDFDILKESLKYSIPLMPHNLATRIATFASRIFINTSGTLASVGLYSIAMNFANLIDVIQTSVNKAFQPWFFEMMNTNDAESRKDVVSFSTLLLIFYTLIYMIIGLFSQEIVILMTNENYRMSWTVIPILVIGFSVKSIYYFFVNIIMYFKQAARKLFIATMAGSFSDIILAYLLVPVYGIYGAALAFLFAKIITVTLVITISKQNYEIGYSAIKMLKIILPSLIFMGVGLYFSYTKYIDEFNWYNFYYKICVLTVYLAFIYLKYKKSIKRIIKVEKFESIFKKKLLKKD